VCLYYFSDPLFETRSRNPRADVGIAKTDPEASPKINFPAIGTSKALLITHLVLLCGLVSVYNLTLQPLGRLGVLLEGVLFNYY
jgi:hypothetical protein